MRETGAGHLDTGVPRGMRRRRHQGAGLANGRPTRPDPLDLMLPKVDGLTCLPTTEAGRPQRPTPILMMTALGAQKGQVERVSTQAPSDYLTKTLSTRRTAGSGQSPARRSDPAQMALREKRDPQLRPRSPWCRSVRGESGSTKAVAPHPPGIRAGCHCLMQNAMSDRRPHR